MTDRASQYVIGPTDPITGVYNLGQTLGQPGQFGYAVLATHKRTSQSRAVKVINKTRFERTSDRKAYCMQLREEISVMKKLNHPNIIKMYDVYEDKTSLYIVMELCAGGELFERIRDATAFNEQDAAMILRQIFMGLKYLHDNKIAHCDLKPDNFLFVDSKPESAIKIIDFGMSKFVEPRKYLQGLCGTPYYVAPEVIEGKYSHHCDMWSMGAVTFVMLFGYPPFYADPEQCGSTAAADQVIFDLIRKGFDPSVKAGYGPFFPSDIPISDSAKDFISKLLQLNPTERISVDEALEHSWLLGSTASNKPMISAVFTNLKTFTKSTRFKNALLQHMSHKLSDDEVNRLKVAFKALDADGDGRITVAEFKTAMSKLDEKTNLEEIETLFSIADADGDGTLSYDELVMTSVQRKLCAKEERLWDLFTSMDLNGDGKLTAEEIEKALGSTEARALVAEIDKNGDGVVDYDEFLIMWMSKEQTKFA